MAPANPTLAKEAWPVLPPIEPALADLLNPAIGRGGAGPGSQTGLQPPPDNSFDRRADFSAAHTARKSTAKGFNEAPQTGYTAKSLGPIDPDLARALGISDEEGGDDRRGSLPSPGGGGSPAEVRMASEGGRGGVNAEHGAQSPAPPVLTPTRSRFARSTSPFQGEVGAGATARALERLLREGRPEFAEKPW